ncbi:MAG: single-stranded-DNA-specific exonuclease RecJ, partial [Gemmatimonadaceae bacterium]
MMTKLEFSTWSLRDADPASAAAFVVAGVPHLIALILAARGFRSIEEVTAFVELSARDLTPPSDLDGMEPAMARLTLAIVRGERVLVNGDFDADGVTSTTILTRGLETLGVPVTVFVPDRALDGHGFKAGGVERASEAGAKLIIAVDCGVSERETVDLATSIGIDTIIIDHHEPEGPLPRATAVIDPKAYPPKDGVLTDVSAAMLAYKFVWAALRIAADEGRITDLKAKRVLRECVDLAAVGTIADSMPLVGENRGLVRSALDRLHRTEISGLSALIVDAFATQRGRSTGTLRSRANAMRPTTGKRITARDISHAVAPVLNAFGRMGDASRAVALLTAGRSEAPGLATVGRFENEARRAEEQRVFDAALAQVDISKESGAIVAVGSDWHPGVLGNVAPRLAEKFGRPAIVLSFRTGASRTQSDLARGSARGPAGSNVLGLLDSVSTYIKSYGGHKGAAGLSVERKNLDAFREALHASADSALGSTAPATPFDVDVTATIHQLLDPAL